MQERNTSFLNNIHCIGISHRTAPIEIREQYALPPKDASHFYGVARRNRFPRELFILSTCNRAEIYSISDELDKIVQWVTERYKELGQSYSDSADCQLVVKSGGNAVRHLFRVSAGMDSMMLGETQITSQVKAAYNQAKSNGMIGPIFNRLIQSSLEAGKRVRTETSLSGRAISVSYAAVEKASQAFPDLSQVTVLLVGAGSTGRLTITYFRKRGANQFFVSNRNAKRGMKLAKEIEGIFVPLSEVEQVLPEIQIGVTCTSAKAPLLKFELLKNCLTNRKPPTLLLDLSVPRNIEPEVGGLPGVTLYTIDDLESVVSDNIARRERELPKAEQIIDEVFEKFTLWLRTLAVAPTIRELKHHFDEVKKAEIRRVQSSYSPETVVAIEEVSDRVIRKLLKRPISTLKALAESDNGVPEIVQILRSIYHLDIQNGNE